MAKADTGNEIGQYVALLRGINLAGKNKLPMKDLAGLFAQAGCVQVKTYIQSGNVVFHAAPKCASGLPSVIQDRIGKQFGLKVPVILRTAKEWFNVVEANPFLKQGAGPDSLHVLFLAHATPAIAVASLDPDRSPPDKFIVLGREIFLHLPDGMGRSKLTNSYFDSKLKTVSTARNWRTVLQIAEMLRGVSETSRKAVFDEFRG